MLVSQHPSAILQMLQQYNRTKTRHICVYLQMLIHSNFPILLQYPQYLSTLGEIARPRLDLDMYGSACCTSISRY